MKRLRFLAAAAAVASTVAPAYADSIPSSSGPGTARPYLGHAAHAHPFAFGPRSPRHPFMAPNAKSNIHDDAYQSDAYVGAGPLGRHPSVSSTFLVHECGSLTFDTHGRIVSVCVGVEGPVLHMFAAHSLKSLASYRLPPRKASTVATAFTSFGGGGYFYLDNKNRAVVPTTTGHVFVLAERGTSFMKVHDYDLTPAIGSAAIESALPDWSGRLWFVSTEGVVGFIGRHGRLRTVDLHQPIGNSFAVDETGAVWVVTDDALYRFVARDSRPRVAWKVRYPHGSRVKPGQTEHGSGTTPTIIRRHGHHFIAITDNADPRMHVLVYRAGVRRPVCRQAVFPKHEGSTDNSLIAIGNSILVENNYGYTGPSQRPPSGPYRTTPTTTPGLTRIGVHYAHGGCHVAWTNNRVRIPSVVSKASAATGLVYVYEHPAAGEVHYTGARPSSSNSADPWYFTAISLRTGRRVFSVLTGYGLGYNNNYAPVTLAPDGTAYVGTLGGLVEIRDSRD